MTDREKLRDLIQDGHGYFYSEEYRGLEVYDAMAEYLLANGVIFATDTNDGGKWIPVSERLPKKGQTVLCYRAQNDMRTGEIVGVHPRKKHIVAFTNRELNTVFTATHWMPLPEPPKEDE